MFYNYIMKKKIKSTSNFVTKSLQVDVTLITKNLFKYSIIK